MKNVNRQAGRVSVIAAVVVQGLLSTSPCWGQNDTTSSSSTVTNNGVENSRINQRDRQDKSRTPIDQGNSKEDIRLSQEIRKSVVNHTNHFSILAHNIKIITYNGKVTLRGPVENNEEKKRIAAVAQSITGANNVSDLLEVKANQ